MNNLFRDLRADEIECRVSTCSEKGVSLLLYKDARCDMNILDENIGPMNWKREHSRDNANCTVSIWDASKNQWISKEDTGKESNTEQEKGLASDSFKRACFNWGIGRELYTAPFIWIKSGDVEVRENPRKKGAYMTYDKFRVKEIDIHDKKILSLSIVNEKTKKVVYHFGGASLYQENTDHLHGVSQNGISDSCNSDIAETAPLDEKNVNSMRRYIANHGLSEKIICELYKKERLSDFSFKQYTNVMDGKYLGYWKQKCGVE